MAATLKETPAQRAVLRVFLLGVALGAIGLAWLELARAQRLYREDLAYVLHPSSDPRIVHDVGRAAPAIAQFGACQVELKGTARKAQYKPLRDVHGGTVVELADGRRLALAPTTPIDFSPWRPDALARDPLSEETTAVIASLPERNQPGTFRITCLSPTEELYVSGCVDGESLVPCSGDQTVTLAPGGRPRARAWITRHAAGSIGFACMLLMIPLLCAWLLAAHLRAITRTLGDHARGRPTRKATLGTVALIVSVGALGEVVLRVTPLWDNLSGPIVGLVLSMALAGVVVFHLLRRIGQVSAALRVVSQTPTSALHDAPEGPLRELAARVANDAPTRDAPAGASAALIRVEIDDKTPPLDLPRRIPVEDASGAGVLDLERAVLDVAPGGADARTLASIRELLASLGATVVEADDLIGYRPETYTSKGKTRAHTYVCSWWSLAPGAPLLIYGDVRHVLPEAAGVRVPGDAGYRAAPTVPLVRAGDQGMIVYVGEESDLRTRLRRELRFTEVAGPVFLGVFLAGLGLAGYVLR